MLLGQLTHKGIWEWGGGDLIQSIICPELDQHRLDFTTQLETIREKLPWPRNYMQQNKKIKLFTFTILDRTATGQNNVSSQPFNRAIFYPFDLYRAHI